MAKRRLITFDWAMKRLLRSKANFEILEGFLSELLKDSIRIMEILESESNKTHPKAKFNRVDMKVKNDKNEIIIIEVQYDREYDYLQRILFGTSTVITEHIHEPKPYSEIVKVISVNILYFDLGEGEDYIYHGATVFKGLHHNDELLLDERQRSLYNKKGIGHVFPEYYLLKVNNFDDIAKDTLDEWVYFLKNGKIKDTFQAQGIKQANAKMDILALSNDERQAYSRYVDDLHYEASMVESSYGWGVIKGTKIGTELGIKQGEKQRAVEIAANLLDILDAETIALKTGLTIGEVNALKVQGDVRR